MQHNSERWLSGLRRSPGKRVYGDTVPRVRIPLSPPKCERPLLGPFAFLPSGSRMRALFDQRSRAAACWQGVREASELNPSLSASKSGLRVVSDQRLSKAFCFPQLLGLFPHLSRTVLGDSGTHLPRNSDKSLRGFLVVRDHATGKPKYSRCHDQDQKPLSWTSDQN